jgi:RNA polymerase sigma factor (sigma-70 family)
MSRRGQRAGATLRVEALEDRTVTSTLNIPSLGAFIGIHDGVEIISRDPAHAPGDSPTIFGLDGPAFEKLLRDIHTIEARTLDLLNQSATILLRWTLPGLLGDNVAKFRREQNLAPSEIFPGSGVPPPPVAFSHSLDPDRADNIMAGPNPPGELAKPDSSAAPANFVNGTGVDGCRALRSGATAVPEVPNAPTTSSVRDGVGQFDLTYQVYPSRIPDACVTQRIGDVSGPAGPETHGSAGQAVQSAPVAISGARRDFGHLPDGSLLQRFVAEGEQAAFTVLVQRYEPLVLGVCQRVLGDSHAAQDAFQATFMVLARKASMLDAEKPLAGWLYQVAYHLALRLRAVAARQRRCERDLANGRPTRTVSEPSVDVEKKEMRQALIEELQRLPEKYRAPLVLCYFDGRTHEEAARAIGLPRGSMAKRIGEGLRYLRERLLERGFLP